jgi:hypothetical protein
VKIPKRGPDKQHHVDERLLEAVRYYLSMHVGTDGCLSASSVIGDRLGHSDQRIADALSVLESSKAIVVHREFFPPMIELPGQQKNPIADIDFCIRELEELRRTVVGLLDKYGDLTREVADWRELAPRLTKEVYVPTSKRLILAFSFDERPSKSYLKREEQE